MKQSCFFSGFVIMLMAYSLPLQATPDDHQPQPLLIHDIPLNPNDSLLASFRTSASDRMTHCAPHRGWSAVWNSDNSRIAVATGSGLGTADCPYSGAVQVFRMDGNKTPELLYTLDSADFVRSVAINPVNGWLAAAGEKVRIYDLGSGRLLYTLEDTASQMTRVVFSPDGTHLAATGGREYKLWIYDLASLASPEHTIAHATDWLLSVAYSPDGRFIGTVGLDGMVRVYDPGNPTVPLYSVSPRRHKDAINDIDFYNSTLIATVASQADIYDIPAFSLLYTHGGFHGFVRSVEFSGNGQWLAVSGTNDIIRIFDMGNPISLRFTLIEPEGTVQDVTFSNDSHYLAATVVTEGENVLIYRMPAMDSETDTQVSTGPDRVAGNVELPSASDIPAGPEQPTATESICLLSEPVTFDDNCYPLATLISLNDYRNQKACLGKRLDEAREQVTECEKREGETNNIIFTLSRANPDPGSQYYEIDSQVFSTYLLLVDQLQRIQDEKYSYQKKANALQKRLSKLSFLLFALRGIDLETLRLSTSMP